jgi:SAM-dependent methyltransferase
MGFYPEDTGFSNRTWPSFASSGTVEFLVPGWRALAWLEAQSGQTLLDIGASDSVLRCAAQSHLLATGLEFSPEAAAMAQKNAPEAKVFIGSLEALPFDAGSFDLVTCLGTPSCLVNPSANFSEIQRVLKPAGRLCVVLPLQREGQGAADPMSPVRGGSCEAWEALLNQAGFGLRGVWPQDQAGQKFVFSKPARFAGLRLWRRWFWQKAPWMRRRAFAFLAEKNPGLAPTLEFIATADCLTR